MTKVNWSRRRTGGKKTPEAEGHHDPSVCILGIPLYPSIHSAFQPPPIHPRHIYLSFHPCICSSMHPPTCTLSSSIFTYIYLYAYSSTHLPIYSINLYASIYPSIHAPFTSSLIYRFHSSGYPSIHPPVCLSICLRVLLL